jgi:hypothetical protein
MTTVVMRQRESYLWKMAAGNVGKTARIVVNVKKTHANCPTCHCATQAKAGKASIAKLTVEERSALARKGGLAKAAAKEVLGQKVLGNVDRKVRDSAIKRMRAAGREGTTHTLIREIWARSPMALIAKDGES